jgi:hypothetical protein
MYEYQFIGYSFWNRLLLFKILPSRHWFIVDLSDPYALNIPMDVFCLYTEKNKIWITSTKCEAKHDLWGMIRILDVLVPDLYLQPTILNNTVSYCPIPLPF